MNLWNPIPIDPDVRDATRRISRVRLINTCIAMGFGLLAVVFAGGIGTVIVELAWFDCESHRGGSGDLSVRFAGAIAVVVFLGTCRAAALFFRRPRPEDVALVGQDV